MDLKITYQNNQFEGGSSRRTDRDNLMSYGDFQNYESFYAQVYQQMFHSLYSYGMQICGNKDLVKDCVQDLFSELWKNQRLTRIRSVKPYLLKCIKRKIQRALGKGRQLYVEGGFEFEISHEVKIIRNQQNDRQQRKLSRALKSLTNRQREAIYLKFYDNLSYEEVAEVLNTKTKASYKLIYRALSSLKLAMKTSL